MRDGKGPGVAERTIEFISMFGVVVLSSLFGRFRQHRGIF
jgi:DNA topoisomerase VI subunit B